MKRSIKVMKIPETSNIYLLNQSDFSLQHSKKSNVPKKSTIEKVEFTMEENNFLSPRKNLIKHIYKEKDNPMQFIKGKSKEKNIKNQKSNTIYSTSKNIANVVKKYINKKSEKEINDSISPKKIYPISYKNIQNLNKVKIINKSQSNPTFSKPQDMNMESNFMKLSNEANIYTSNANYIQNKKVLLFNKYYYDKNKYVPDRAKLFDITRMPKMPKKHSFIYKTTKFRAGHLINGNDNNDYSKNFGSSSLIELNLLKNGNDIKKGSINNNEYNNNLKFGKYEEYNTPYSYIDKSYQRNKKNTASDTFYKELMSKKIETYEQYFKNNMDEKEDKETNMEENYEFNELNELNELNSEINNNNYNANNIDKEPQGFLQSYYKDNTNKKKPEVRKLYYKQIQKNKNNDLNGYSPLLSKKKNIMGQNIQCPKIFSSNIDFENYSQKERFEKIAENFAGLKNLMETFKKKGELNELDYIYEYAINKNINKKFLTIKNLTNFYNFLHEKNIPLDSRKSLKENIIFALNYDMNAKKEEKNKKKRQIFIKKENKISDKNIKIKNKNKLNDLKEIRNLMLDLNLQKKISNQENFSVDKIHIRDELQKEIDDIKNEVINKQKIIQKIRNDEGKIKNYEKVFHSNERLYYTWYKNKKGKDLNNFSKKSKLTELYFYNKAKEEIKKNDMEKKYFGNK